MTPWLADNQGSQLCATHGCQQGMGSLAIRRKSVSTAVPAFHHAFCVFCSCEWVSKQYSPAVAGLLPIFSCIALVRWRVRSRRCRDVAFCGCVPSCLLFSWFLVENGELPVWTLFYAIAMSFSRNRTVFRNRICDLCFDPSRVTN